MSVFAQKLSEPPSPPGNVQHWLYVVLVVQSAFVVQSWTIWVPVHVLPSEVSQALGAAHAIVIAPVVHAGAVPPVMGIVPQQTSGAPSLALPGQPAGAEHAPELEPELAPELLLPELDPPELEPDEDDPELEPELDADPELDPELDPDADPLDELLEVGPPSPEPDPPEPPELEHAPRTPSTSTGRATGTSSQVVRMASW
jgi:hypothetical protein